MSRRRPTAAAVVFALLALATVAAFAYAQQKKRDPLIIDRVELGKPKGFPFTPNGDCVRDTVRIKFRTTTSNDATIEVVEPGGAVVKTLARGRFLKRYSFHEFHWDGTGEANLTAGVGRYRVRVLLEDEDRSLLLPGTIRLHYVHPSSACRKLEPAKGGGKSS